jgi:hypothetical protein
MQGETERSAAALELTSTEKQILVRLARQGCLSTEQACVITGSVQVHINNLRKKLSHYGIEVLTSYKFGWEMDRKSRAKVLELLARPKPTSPIRTSPTGAAEATGANFRTAGAPCGRLMNSGGDHNERCRKPSGTPRQ